MLSHNDSHKEWKIVTFKLCFIFVGKAKKYETWLKSFAREKHSSLFMLSDLEKEWATATLLNICLIFRLGRKVFPHTNTLAYFL
jgi:hypothetical protein